MDIRWSPTRISTWRTCPRQYDYRYNRPRTGEMNFDLSTSQKMGIVAHAGLQAAYEKAAAADNVRRVDLMDRYVGEAVAAVHQCSNMPETLLTTAESAQVECEVVEVLMRLPAPVPSSVLAVEETLRGRSPAGHELEARVDLILRTGPASIHVRDWKRRALSSLPNAERLAADDQLGQYSYLAASRWPWVRRITVGLYSITSNREVAVEITAEGAREILNGHDVLIEQIEQAETFPPKPSADSCPRCPSRRACPVWRKNA